MTRLKSANCKKRILSAVFASIMFVFCAFSLCACDREDKVEASDVSYKLHLLGYAYNNADGTVTAVLSFAGDNAAEIDYPEIAGTRRVYQKNLWKNAVEIDVPLMSDSIFCAVRDSMPQEAWVHDDVVFDRLKVVLRYDTIYKSITTNGLRTVSGNYFLHSFAIEEGVERAVFKIEQTSQNSANWYSALIACGILFALIAAGIYLAVAFIKRDKQ